MTAAMWIGRSRPSRSCTAGGTPTRYQLAPGSVPADRDARLEARGYAREAESIVMTADLACAAGPIPGRPVALAPDADPRWAATWWAFDRGAAAPPALMAILRGAHGSLAHAILHADGKVGSVGRGNVDDGWLGVFAMATRPDRRRQGLAAAVLGALTEWGTKQGATTAYLQVDAHNHAAQALYRAAGFSEA